MFAGMSRPNILFIHAHNTGRFVQPYGYDVPTPRMLQLAQQGVLFRQAYTVSPSCTPSRGALLSGQYPHVTGLCGLAHRGWRLRDYRQTLIHLLNDAGYLTVLAGLQHIARDRAEPGYQLDLQPPGQTGAEVVPGVQRFLQQTHEQPWFLDVGLREAHRAYPEPTAADDPRYVRVPPAIPDTPRTREDFAGYRAAARLMDDSFGAVLDALESSGQAENTLVICLADHGLQWPHYMANVTDRGLETFFILRGPGGFTGGKCCDALVSHLDVLPTVCDLAGIATPDWAAGKSLLPLMDGSVDHLHDELFGEQTYHAAYDPQRTIRTRQFRYLRWYGDRRRILMPNIDRGLTRDELVDHGLVESPRPSEALYDLMLDPNEMRDCRDDPRYAQVLADLRQRLDQWMRATNDPLLAGDVPAPPGSQVTHPDGLHPMDNVLTMA